MQSLLITIRRPKIAGWTIMLLAMGGCFGSGNAGPPPSTTQNTNGGTTRASDAARQYPLDSLPTATIQAKGQDVRVWLAQEFDPQRPDIVQEGLMHVPPEEIADDQGMLFVFSDERLRSFWMLNTITPLDIAFARWDGTVVKTWQMPPRTLQTFPSIEPAMFALEVKQGAFARLGLQDGDRLTIPDVVFKTQP
jgi:uncharacterized membrane protein (UPF0127 family)